MVAAIRSMIATSIALVGSCGAIPAHFATCLAHFSCRSPRADHFSRQHGAGLTLFIMQVDPDDQPLLEPVTAAEIHAIVTGKSGLFRDVMIIHKAIIAQLLEDAIAVQGGQA